MLNDIWELRTPREASFRLCFKLNINCPLVLGPGKKTLQVVLVANAKTNQMSSFECNVVDTLHVFHCTLTHEHLLKRLMYRCSNGIKALWDYGSAERTMTALPNEPCETLSAEDVRTWQLHRLTQELQANRALQGIEVTGVLQGGHL